MLKRIASICANHLDRIGDILVLPTSEDNREKLQVAIVPKGDEFDIIVERFGLVEAGDPTEGTTLSKRENEVTHFNEDTDHTHILDACLDAISQDEEIRSRISELTTDGGSKDCEAIFNLDGYGYVILKVR